MPQGIIQEVEAKPKTSKHREYRRVCIEGAWYSCWLKSLFPFLNKGDLIDFKVKVSGDFENIISVEGIKKMTEIPPQDEPTEARARAPAETVRAIPVITAAITKTTVNQRSSLAIVNELQELLNLCRIAVRVTYKHELKKDPKLEITPTVNTMFIQLCRINHGRLVKVKKEGSAKNDSN